jgi:hypothetical protein
LKFSCYYLGDKVEVNAYHDPSEKTDCTFVNNQLIVTGDCDTQEKINLLVKRFLVKQCKRHIQNRIVHFQPSFKTKPRKVTIEESYNKWGSCNSNRDLTFNWLLITKSPEAIDYVVVHEMCHMTHLNHDRSFWRLLGKLLPDYKTYQKELNEQPH